ncbi:MAG: hypothetical protein GF315_07040 [candidate division Zixibacteria bacterium]|nr:hypothetical protein [candidate division Zixibacteria bacterium]
MKKKVIVEPSETLFKLPEPLGAQFTGLARRVEKRNIDIIDLGKISIDFPDKLKTLLKIDQSEIWGDAARLAKFELRLKQKIADTGTPHEGLVEEPRFLRFDKQYIILIR